MTFGSPLIEEPEIADVVASLRSGWLGTGPKVKKFEEMFSEYKGSSHAIAVNSCTAALHLSMLAIGIEPGDEVLLPAMTFAATANSVIHSGGRPVLVDCDRDNMTMDVDDIKRKLTRKTKAIIPVHFAGYPCDMDRIMEISRKKGIKVIEDCAHAIETEYKGMKAGTIGDIGCFSFYVTKNIVTGEGGMLITDNKEYADKIKVLALHGMSQDAWQRYADKGYKHYRVIYAGFKYNMTDIQAAIGINQLPRIGSYNKKRRDIWEAYDEAFRDLPVFLPRGSAEGVKHANHLYTLLLDIERLGINRDGFLEEMTTRGIGVGVHYISLNLHPYYMETYGYGKGDFPDSEWISERTVSLPLSPKMGEREKEKVIRAVREILLENVRDMETERA